MVMGIYPWSYYFVISKFSDYMEYYVMVLEQCGHIVARVQATVTRLGEDQIHVCSVT